MSRVLTRYGSLSKDSLSSIVRGIYVGRKSGVLYLSDEKVSKRLYFNQGSIVFACSDDDEDRLGEVLAREGRIKRSDLEFVWQVMKQTGRSLEETLVEMEFMSLGEIEALAVRRRALVNRCVKKFRQQQPSTTPLPCLHLQIERPGEPLASAPVR